MADISLVAALGNRMDHLIGRQTVVSSNVANANTPNYISRDMTFERLTANKSASKNNSLKSTHSKHFAGSGAASMGGSIVKDESHIRHDGNSVKLDEEMFKLNEIQMNYGLMVQLYTKQKQLQQLVVRNN